MKFLTLLASALLTFSTFADPATIEGGVQLWEGGPYWAECNVGASDPGGCGYYFMWGDTVGYTSSLPSNCLTKWKSCAELQAAGYIDSTGNLLAEHDAATSMLGTPWRMPTAAEFNALINNCTSIWTTRNGIEGRLMTGKGAYASRSIFLPAAGGIDEWDSDNRAKNYYGYYWSSTTRSVERESWSLTFNTEGFIDNIDYSPPRNGGVSVRAVRDFIQSCTVTFDPDGGYTSETNRTYAYGATLGALPTASRDGYEFVGWYTSQEGGDQVSDETIITSNATYCAQWNEIILYPITYTNLKDATHTNPATYKKGIQVIFSTPSEIPGYTFAGWAPRSITDTMTGPQIVSANWKTNAYTIIYYANGGSGSMSSTVASYDEYVTLAKNKFVRPGYRFVGWSTYTAFYEPGAVVKNLSSLQNGVVPLYAEWVETVSSVTASHSVGSGKINLVVSLEGTEEDVSKVEYTFAATNSATNASVPINSITKDGAIEGSGTNWVQKFIWDVVADVGNVKIDDLVLTVGIREGVEVSATMHLSFDGRSPDGGPYTEIVDGNEWTYYVKDGKAMIGSKKTLVGAVVMAEAGVLKIPDTLGGCPVTGIGEFAFSGCSLITSITLSSAVTTIEDDAFAGCTALRTVYVDTGDVNRIKALMSGKGIDVDILEFMEDSHPVSRVCYFPLDGDGTAVGSLSNDWVTVETNVSFVTDSMFGTGSYKADAGSIIVSDAENGLGDSENGWAISLWFHGNGMANWRDVFGFQIGDYVYKLESCSGAAFQIYNISDTANTNGSWTTNGGLSSDISASRDSWHHLLVQANTTADGFDIYLDGNFNQSYVRTNCKPALSKVVIGTKGIHNYTGTSHSSNDGRASSALVDEVAVYDGRLSLDQIRYLALSNPIDFSGEELPLPETPNYLYDGATFAHSGWFENTGTGSENFTTDAMAIGPTGGKVGAVVTGHHPYTSGTLPASFTLAAYIDLSPVSAASAESQAVVWSTGTSSSDRIMLLYDGENVSLSAAGGESVSLPVPSAGYHLYTSIFTTSGITLVIDAGGEGKVASCRGTYNAVSARFQIGSVYSGLPSGFCSPIGLAVAKLVGYSQALSLQQVASLSESYPAVNTITGVINYSVAGGKFYVGSMTHTDGRLEIDRGTLFVPSNCTYSVPSLRFGNYGGSGDSVAFGLELDGTLVISGGQTTDGSGQSGVRSDVVNNRGGVLGGEWTGQGVYNIRGTFNAANSFVQLVHDAHAQTWNVASGGVFKVKAFEARTSSGKERSSSVLNVKAGGRVVSTYGFTRGKMMAVVEDGGTLEIANTANVNMESSDLSSITGAGRFVISNASGTGYTLLPNTQTNYFAETLEFVANSEFYLTAAGDFAIGSLSGCGNLNTKYATGGRTLTINQSKDTVWSGTIVADNQNRLTAICVASTNEATLTITGTNNQSTKLELHAGGRVILPPTWGTVTSGVAGMEVCNSGSVYSLIAIVPSIPGDAGATVTGNAESGFVVTPSAGATAVEVSIPNGVEAAKVTVEVSPSVAQITPNGAAVKIVKIVDGVKRDITPYLDLPAAVGGVVDLSAADVKAEVAAEAIDTSKGAEIVIDAAEPSITTANTKPGLVYTLREGTSLKSMADGDSKVGDGQPWTPNVTVKGGASGFYSIGVGK